jgi:enamine deaminase RidA (YjgF/YER057c/UK114 family)
MSHMLQSAGSSMERVVRIQLVLADLEHINEVESVYREFFPLNPPARTLIAMQLRGGGGCEIECVALAGV